MASIFEVNTHPERESETTKQFRCDVCDITLRSEAKLEQHIKYSPMHESNIKANEPDQEQQASTKRVSRQRLIYDGTKLFWRINKTFDINIYESLDSGTLTILACDEESGKELSPLYLDLKTTEEAAEASTDGVSRRETIIKFIIERLSAEKERRRTFLLMQKLAEDKYDSLYKLKTGNEQDPLVQRRRRHTYEDMLEKQKEFNEEAEALKVARETADSKSELARLSLEAFKNIADEVKSRHTFDGNPTQLWSGAVTRVKRKNQVQRTRSVLRGYTMPTQSAMRKCQAPIPTPK